MTRTERKVFTAPVPLTNPVQMIYGTFVLFVAWFHFNAGSTGGLTGSRDDLAARVLVVNMVAGGASCVAAAAWSPRGQSSASRDSSSRRAHRPCIELRSIRMLRGQYVALE